MNNSSITTVDNLSTAQKNILQNVIIKLSGSDIKIGKDN
jgi:hypothetical protein